MNSLIDLKRLGEKSGNRKKSALYADIQGGLLPPAVKLGGKNTWPEDEIDAVHRARIAGKTDDEIRALVKHLIAQRSQLQAA